MTTLSVCVDNTVHGYKWTESESSEKAEAKKCFAWRRKIVLIRIRQLRQTDRQWETQCKQLVLHAVRTLAARHTHISIQYTLISVGRLSACANVMASEARHRFFDIRRAATRESIRRKRQKHRRCMHGTNRNRKISPKRPLNVSDISAIWALLFTVECRCTFIIRPPVYGSNGRTYKMLVMFIFLFFAHRSPSSLDRSPWNFATWSESACIL